MAMLARLPQPAAVAITMPSTSPIAQPVRQCRVAVIASRQLASIQPSCLERRERSRAGWAGEPDPRLHRRRGPPGSRAEVGHREPEVLPAWVAEMDYAVAPPMIGSGARRRGVPG